MGEELKAGCARPTGGPVGEPAPEENAAETNETKITDSIYILELQRGEKGESSAAKTFFLHHSTPRLLLLRQRELRQHSSDHALSAPQPAPLRLREPPGRGSEQGGRNQSDFN